MAIINHSHLLLEPASSVTASNDRLIKAILQSALNRNNSKETQ